MDEAAERNLMTPETLESLLQSSKTPDGRSHLASSATLPSLLRHLPSSPPALHLPILRLLRNLCAGEISSQDSFIRSNGPDAVASLLLQPQAPPPEVLRVGLQLLGNVALAGEPHRSALWSRFFPAGFLEIGRLREPAVCDALCMVLDTCCSSEGGRRRLEELCRDGRGLEVVGQLIAAASTGGYREEWLEWLLAKLCIEEPYFFQLFSKLGSLDGLDKSDSHDLENSPFTTEQAFLFRVLSKCLSERPREVTVSKDFSLGVLKVMKEAINNVDFSFRGRSELPTGSPIVDILGYSLTILRDICAWDDPSSSATEAPVESLLSAGILKYVLNLLRELEPPSIVKKSIAQANNGAVQSDTSDKVCPYKGYRRDVVSVIANCLHGRKVVQDEIRKRNGIPLLLQQCVLDEDNPFLREWGLLAVRNLLEGNLENQHEVAELKLQGPVDTPEIAELGLKVEVDEKSGKAKLVNLS